MDVQICLAIVTGGASGLSVGKLFIGSLVPGLIFSFMYILYVLVLCWFKPELGPPLTKEERSQISMPQILKMALVSLGPPVILIAGVLGSIFTGIATPTEASGVGAFLALLMTIAYRRFSWDTLKEVALSTGKTIGMVMMILVGATCFTGVFMGTGAAVRCRLSFWNSASENGGPLWPCILLSLF